MKWCLILVLTLCVACYSTERNCLPFHQGVFEYTTVVNGEIKTSVLNEMQTMKLNIMTVKLIAPPFVGLMIANAY